MSNSGWNRPSSTRPPVRKKPSALRGIVAGLVVVILALAGAWYFLGGDSASPASKEKQREPVKNAAKSYKSVEDISRIKKRKEYAAKPKTVDEALARVAESQEPIQISPIKGKASGRGRIFKTGPEQLLSWLCHTELGDMPMPIPPITGEDRDNIVGILISKNEITEEDDEKTANAKTMVDAAKKEMLNYIKQGGDPNDFMKYYYNELRKAFEKRNCAIDMYEELDDEDPAMAREFAKKVNAQFEADGIKAIPVREGQEDEPLQ